MKAAAAAAPIADPTIIPVWWEVCAAADGDIDVKDDELDEDNGVASSGGDEVMSDAEEVVSRTNACPPLKNSPLFSLQQLSATVPFPQQYLLSPQGVTT